MKNLKLVIAAVLVPILAYAQVPSKLRSETHSVVEASKPVVTLSSQMLRPGDPVTIDISGLPGNAQDWLTLVAVDAPTSTFGEWTYTNGVTEGSWTFTAPTPGDYEVRVFFDYPEGGFTIHARAPLQVSTAAAAPTISADDPKIQAILARWDYKNDGYIPAADARIRGVYLGQPLDDARAAIEGEGFSLVDRSPLEYGMVLGEIGGEQKWYSAEEWLEIPFSADKKAIRQLRMIIETTSASTEIAAELLGGAASDDAAKTKFVKSFHYRQRFLTGEQLDYDMLARRVREQFGEPNYTTARRAGAAFNSRAKWWYVDNGLASKQQIGALLARIQVKRYLDSQRNMLFATLYHPGTTEHTVYTEIFEDFSDIRSALRIAYAPFLSVDIASGELAVKAEWQFLEAERAHAKMFAEKQERESAPKADVKF